MSAYTRRPFTDDERSYVQFMLSYLQNFQKLRPLLAASRWFFSVSICIVLMLFLILGIFGQSRLTLAIALLLGLTVGNGINLAWTRASLRAEEDWEKQWAEQREQWASILEEGAVEVLAAPVSEYVLVGSEDSSEEGEGVAFISVGESETLCLFTSELGTEDVEKLPGARLTITRFPFTGTVFQIDCTGKPPEALCTLNWSDFEGFSSAESFFGWLVHGKVYALSLDRLERELISLE